MVQAFKKRIAEKYRLITFLVVTSVIGMLLILVAVYNASRELEIIHEVDNLYRLSQASLGRHNGTDVSMHPFTTLSTDNYQLQILENGRAINIHDLNLRNNFPLDMSQLEQSRVNKHGGYMTVEDQIYTWVMTPIANTNRHVVLIHKYMESAPGTFLKVYSKRLLIPAIFYIWVMIWAALILRNLTDRLRSQNVELERMALHDSLTGLPNRTLLADRLQKLIQNCRRNQRTFALAIIDLDHFKKVNDTLGHDQGDELLRLFTVRIRDILRASDTAARIGGDEFVLLLHDADEESCLAMCERIRASITKPYCLREAEVNIGLSVGIAMFPKHGEESTTLMRNADLAMYSIKSKGGGINLYAGHQKVLNGILPGAAASST